MTFKLISDTMTLNAGNDWLLCKVFQANLLGSGLAWFHKLSRYSINLFYKLWLHSYHNISTRCDKRKTSDPYKPFSNKKKNQSMTSQGGLGKPYCK